MGMHAGRGTIALTGATGFLGSHIADALLAGGWAVRASVRPASSLRWLEGKPVRTVTVDLADPADCARLLDGTAGLIHCAGVVAARDEAGFHRGNVATTAALLEAAAAVWTEPLPDPAPAFVLISSLAAHGPAPLGRPAVETDPAAPLSAYGRSKREAERLVATAPGLFRRAVLRPPALYGPRDREFLPLLRLAARGWTVRLGSLEGLSLVDGRDAAAAAVALLATPAAEGVFFVDDGQRGYGFAALADALGQALGRRVRLATLPLWPLRLGTRLLPRASAVLTSDRAHDLEQPGWVCDGRRLEAVTGFRPQRRAARGLTETVAFARQAGWL
ncbi:MAG: NAD-dependent epimerase/dehydratase family protein [Candidatus Krumholzibacteriia bacterium]